MRATHGLLCSANVLARGYAAAGAARTATGSLGSGSL